VNKGKTGTFAIYVNRIFFMLFLTVPLCGCRGPAIITLADSDISRFEGAEFDWGFGSLLGVPTYRSYIDGFKDAEVSDRNIEISPDDISGMSASGAVDYSGRVAVLSDAANGYIEFTVQVDESALYEIEVDYYLVTGNSNSARRALYIDGANPFVESGDLVFYRYFEDAYEPIINSLGDETRPSQIEIPGWRTTGLMDTSGLHSEPFSFYFENGEHTVRLEHTTADMYISAIRLKAPEAIRPYRQVQAEYREKGYQPVRSEAIVFQAESSAIEKNDPTLRRENDGDPMIQPASATTRKLNVMGGYRWRKGNQSITWEFTAPEEGLYKIALFVKQQWGDGLPSFRQIAIDGRIPFEELKEYKFEYDTRWGLHELGDSSGAPYEFYLTRGRHTVTMTVKFGPIAEIIESLSNDTQVLSDALLSITMLAGSAPDPNYDYRFFERIPELREMLEYLSYSIVYKYNLMSSLTDGNNAMANNFLTIRAQLENMIRNPFSIARRMGDLTSSQECLSNWYLQLQESPLVIDRFTLGDPGERWIGKRSNVFQRFIVTMKLFFSSFFKDYDNVGGILADNIEIDETINVWIARGTEWAEAIKELADESFTPNSGIAINVNVLPGSQLNAGNVNALMLSITSGKAPDVALGVDVTSPVEFAIRDAVYDLSKMPGFDEVRSRFVNALFTPYEYNGGVFAIPETMNFNVMFYRKDILGQYNIPLPQTRRQLYDHVMPALYQNGFEYYHGGLSNSAGGNKDFTQFMFQNGGSYYTEDGLRSALDTPEAYRAFKEYTELFTNYGVPVVANFYQYFRTGIAPIGIGDFGLFMQLSVAAPELAGKWGIAPLPGVEKINLDGTSYIDRTAGSITAQGAIIMGQSTKPEASWEFLKWWSSEEIQARFAREVEALIGAEARWNTANKKAFESLSWKADDLAVIEEQWVWAREVPVVLGGYFTDRHLANAWNTVVITGGEVREALEKAVKDINRELRMKQEEYGVIINGN
jgi:ABC-type glycerol-3-phosphate transport system substrate-binding protein